MRGDKNNHGKNQNHYAKQSKISNRCNQDVNIPNKYSNEVGILNQDKSIITIKMSNILNKYINEAQKESLYQNPQSR